MTIATINLGTAPSGVGGDAARNAFEKVNANFSQTENAASRTVGTVNDNQVLDKAGLQILIKDPRRQEVEALSGGRNTVIYDAQGNPNVMVVIPRFNYQDLGLPDLQLGTGTPTAFLTNGVPRSEILIAKYLASAGGSTCAVGGGVQPLTGVSYDQAKARCTGKGANWHLMSVHEWAAIALWSLANGTVPRGNTNYGRAHDRLFETARRSDNGVPGDLAGTGRTDTGKGPATWTHDHTVHGIHDLVGNVWEWQDQMKLNNGQIQTTLDNNHSMQETDWFAHPVFYDAFGGSVKLNNQVTITAIVNTDFKSITKDAAYVTNQLMRRLLLETATADTCQGMVYVNNNGQRTPIRGGSWFNGTSAGLAALSLELARSGAGNNFGFRPAYFV